MADIIKNPRNGCALHGALQTVQEIDGVVPVVHANAGCGVIIWQIQTHQEVILDLVGILHLAQLPRKDMLFSVVHQD